VFLNLRDASRILDLEAPVLEQLLFLHNIFLNCPIQWFLTFCAPWTPNVSSGTTGGPLNPCKKRLKGSILYFCDLSGPLIPSPQTPWKSLDPRLRNNALDVYFRIQIYQKLLPLWADVCVISDYISDIQLGHNMISHVSTILKASHRALTVWTDKKRVTSMNRDR
jgi:hypothetical protein